MINGKPQKRKYDLEERTSLFAEDVIALMRQIKVDYVNKNIISQVMKSASSIGANYREATEAESKKDFIHKVSMAKKEIKETQHWLRLLAKANPEHRESLVKLWKESRELLLIFSKTISTSKIKMLST
jgi:four helix bundle protein